MESIRGFVMHKASTIRTRILGGYLIAGLLPVLGLFMVYETLNSRAIRQAEFDKMAELTSEVSRQIATIMERAASDMESMATNPRILNPDSSTEEKLSEMDRLIRIYRFFSEITLHDAQGFALGSARGSHTGARDRSKWFMDALHQGRRSVTSPFRMINQPGLFVSVYIPLGAPATHVVTATVRFDEVWKLLDGVEIGKDGQMFLMDEYGTLLAHSDKSRILTPFDSNHPLDKWWSDPRGTYQHEDVDYLYTSRLLTGEETQVGQPWTLVCLEPVHEVDAILAGNRNVQILAAGTGLLFVLLLGLFASRWLSRPLEAAASTAEAVHDGDLSVRMPTEGPREIAHLAESFNKMLTDINDYQNSLEQKVERRTAKMRKAQDALRAERASLAERIDLRTRELRAANVELARSARMKDEFLAGMSHELRTPLNAVLGLTESLEEGTYGDLNERQIDTLKIIEDSGRHLLALINDILDVAKVEAGEMQLDLRETDVRQVCESSLNLVQQTARKKSLQLNFDHDDTVTGLICDERRLKQILVNLLSNAVKFTSEGSVTLKVKGLPEQEAVSLSVSDTGIGIPSDQIEQLFQAFVQLDGSLERQYEGTGLGLSLVYNMVEIHGGSVSVESQTNKGTTFTVMLPWRTQATHHAECETSNQLPAAARACGPILVIDDHESEVQRVATALRTAGYEAITATNGAKGIEIARSLDPAAVLLDVQMPGMDGIETLHHLRSEPRFADLPIIALTALNTPADIRRLREAGMSDTMVKPAAQKTFLPIIETYLSPTSGLSAEAA